MKPLYFKNNPEKRRLRGRRRSKKTAPQISREELNKAIDQYLKDGGKIKRLEDFKKKESSSNPYSKQSIAGDLSGRIY